MARRRRRVESRANSSSAVTVLSLAVAALAALAAWALFVRPETPARPPVSPPAPHPVNAPVVSQPVTEKAPPPSPPTDPRRDTGGWDRSAPPESAWPTRRPTEAAPETDEARLAREVREAAKRQDELARSALLADQVETIADMARFRLESKVPIDRAFLIKSATAELRFAQMNRKLALDVDVDALAVAVTDVAIERATGAVHR